MIYLNSRRAWRQMILHFATITAEVIIEEALADT
jgi:hypothetical protein